MRARSIFAALAPALLAGCTGFTFDEPQGAGGAGGLDAGLDAGPHDDAGADAGPDAGGPAPSCTDGAKNGDETGVDCGGSCKACGFGAGCDLDADCGGGRCVDGSCTADLEWVWERRTTQKAPSARNLAGMAYDESQKRTVLVGGYQPALGTSPASVLGDVWAWDGDAWAQLANPPFLAREGHRLAYQSSTQSILLFGGIQVGGVPVADTYELQGSTWHTIAASPAPGAQQLYSMAYDELRSRTVFFGGGASDGLWEFSGVTWQPLAGAVGPSPKRYGHAMAYDRLRGVSVLFGGTVDQTPGQANDETWEWDGLLWTEASPPAPGPAARFGHAMAFDPDHGLTILVSGTASNVQPAFDDVWSWDGHVWSRLGQAPHVGAWNSLVYDTDRRRLVFVAYDGGESLVETWEGYPLAGQCSADIECGSGHCFDGLCCEASCGACEACNTPKTPGHCAPIAACP